MTNKLPKIGERYKSVMYGYEVEILEADLVDGIKIGYTNDEGCDENIFGISYFLENFEPLPSPKEQEEDDGRCWSDPVEEKEEPCELETAAEEWNMEGDLNESNNTQLNKVQEAKEELKEKIESNIEYPLTNDDALRNVKILRSRLKEMVKFSQNLVNALESIKEPKTDMKEESVDAVDIATLPGRCNFCTRKVEKDILTKNGCCSPSCARDWGNINRVKKTEESLPDIWKDVSELPHFSHKVFVKYKHHKQIIICDALEGSIFNGDIETDLNLVVGWQSVTDFINQQEQTTKKVAELEKLIKEKL